MPSDMAPCWYDAEATKFALPVAVIAASPDNRGNQATCAPLAAGACVMAIGHVSSPACSLQNAHTDAFVGCSNHAASVAFICSWLGSVHTYNKYIIASHRITSRHSTAQHSTAHRNEKQRSKKDLRYRQQGIFPEYQTPFARLAMTAWN